jgi:hypothetical protein
MYKFKSTWMWWKSFGGLRACLNNSNCSSLVYLSFCCVVFVFGCWEKVITLEWELLGKISPWVREFGIYMCIYFQILCCKCSWCGYLYLVQASWKLLGFGKSMVYWGDLYLFRLTRFGVEKVYKLMLLGLLEMLWVMVMVYVDDVWRTKIIHESKLKVFWSQFCFRK